MTSHFWSLQYLQISHCYHEYYLLSIVARGWHQGWLPGIETPGGMQISTLLPTQYLVKKCFYNTEKKLANEMSIETEVSQKHEGRFDEKAKDDATTRTPQFQNSAILCTGHTYSTNWIEIPKFSSCNFRFWGFLTGLSLQETSIEELKKIYSESLIEI